GVGIWQPLAADMAVHQRGIAVDELQPRDAIAAIANSQRQTQCCRRLACHRRRSERSTPVTTLFIANRRRFPEIADFWRRARPTDTSTRLLVQTCFGEIDRR